MYCNGDVRSGTVGERGNAQKGPPKSGFVCTHVAVVPDAREELSAVGLGAARSAVLSTLDVLDMESAGLEWVKEEKKTLAGLGGTRSASQNGLCNQAVAQVYVPGRQRGE